MNPSVSWLFAFMLLTLMIRYLPFIDLEAAVRLQDWLRDMQRKFEKNDND